MHADRRAILHIEPSTRCTLACVHCPRTAYPGSVDICDIDVDLAVEACRGVRMLSLCGDHGDPIYHPRFHELIGAIRSSNPDIAFWINTNGAFRSRDWWADLAGLLDGRDSVAFSIDGLPRNNHIYRTNSRWPTIELGIRTLRSANPGLSMEWKWILFNYNQDDVRDGVRLAKRLGFNYFTLIGSTRIEDPDPVMATRGIGDIREELIASGIPTM